MELLPITYLFVPADRPDRFAKAMAAGADRVILDLEDAVKPGAKPAAREALKAADLDWARVVVRINPVTTPFYADDIAAVAVTGAAGVMFPKAESSGDIAALRCAIGREIEVIPQIETAIGLDRIDDILRADGVRRVAFGHLDFAFDLGTSTDWDALMMIRQQIAWRSRVCGAGAPIDSVTPELTEDAVKADAAKARSYGFGGKLLIHPKQVEPTLAAFMPTEAETKWAQKVIDAVTVGRSGAITVDGRMVDKPVEDAARRILATIR